MPDYATQQLLIREAEAWELLAQTIEDRQAMPLSKVGEFPMTGLCACINALRDDGLIDNYTHIYMFSRVNHALRQSVWLAPRGAWHTRLKFARLFAKRARREAAR